jgi:electron transfer flavoprotein beta subunit
MVQMNVVVLVKWVPDPAGTPKLGDDFLVVREGTDGALDPGDEYAVEAGLQAVETQGGEVTLVSMGPEVAMSAVRKGLSMGAHRGVLVTDPALRGADALGTAQVLAAAIARQPFDLVLSGVESTDGYTGTVPMAVAELLGVPSLTFARKVEVRDGTLRVQRQTDLGYDVIESPLPALATVTGSSAEPRYATLKGIMASKSKPVEQLTLADLGLSPGAVAPSQRVIAVTPAPVKSSGEVIQAGDDTAARIADFLAEAKVI